jgi:Domain of unknown function (DUF4221)
MAFFIFLKPFMKNNLIGALIFLFILVVSCSKEKASIDKVVLTKITEKKFKLDTLTSIKTWYMDIYEIDSASFLVYENKNKPSIQFYNLKGGKLSFEINLNMIGPNGVGVTDGFHIRSLDSIYLINTTDMRVYHVNRKAEVMRVFSFLKSNQSFPFGSMSTPKIISGSPAIYYKGMLQMCALPGMGPTNIETFKSGKVNIALDISKGEFDLNFGYPDIYKTKKFGNFWGKIFRSKTHNDKIVYSFGADLKVQVTDYATTTEYYAGSSYFDDPTPYTDALQMRMNDVKSTMYGGIFYDKYRKLYYRIVTGGVEDAPVGLKGSEAYDIKPLAIIILNLDFEKVGETLLPTKAHDPLGIFVGPEGLYISNSNLYSKNLQENTLSFSIYAPEKLKE